MPTPISFDKFDALDEGEIKLFYGHEDPLANVYKCPVTYNGVGYSSAEQAYHAQKFDPIEDRDVFYAILNSTKPGDAKKIAHENEDRVRVDWSCYTRLRTTIGIVTAKMQQNPKIAKALLETDNKYLVEEAPDDRLWGMVTSGGMLEGSNYMGRILMYVREKLRKEL